MILSRIFLLLSIILAPIIMQAQQTVGLFSNEPTSYNGYTLLFPMGSNTTYLLDNCGHEVHRWYSANTRDQVAYLLEDGTLLHTGQIASNVYSGGGTGGRIEMMDWDGNVTWTYDYASDTFHQHHDIEYLPNGNILVLAWGYKSHAEAIAAGRDTAILNAELWPTQVVELEPVGTNDANIVWQWNLWDHLVQDYDNTKTNYDVVADHPELIDLNFVSNRNAPNAGNADWIHANSIDYNPTLDQIIVNSKNFSEFWIIDHSTTTAEAAGHTGGNSGKGGDILYRWGNPQTFDQGIASDEHLYGQHDTHWIPDGLPNAGKVLIFNNGAGRTGGTGLYSNIEMIEIPTDSAGNYYLENTNTYGPDTAYWNYEANPQTDFYSQNISGSQQQPNGNVLICEGASGHIFEVTSAGDKVWEYINPIQMSGTVSQGTVATMNSVFRAYRYGPNYGAFTGRALTQGDVLELNPLPSNCEIYTDTTTGIDDDLRQGEATDFKIWPNPAVDELHISIPDNDLHSLAIYNLQGGLLYQDTRLISGGTIEVANWQPGFYLVRLDDTNAQKVILTR